MQNELSFNLKLNEKFNLHLMLQINSYNIPIPDGRLILVKKIYQKYFSKMSELLHMRMRGRRKRKKSIGEKKTAFR